MGHRRRGRRRTAKTQEHQRRQGQPDPWPHRPGGRRPAILGGGRFRIHGRHVPHGGAWDPRFSTIVGKKALRHAPPGHFETPTDGGNAFLFPWGVAQCPLRTRFAPRPCIWRRIVDRAAAPFPEIPFGSGHIIRSAPSARQGQQPNGPVRLRPLSPLFRVAFAAPRRACARDHSTPAPWRDARRAPQGPL